MIIATGGEKVKSGKRNAASGQDQFTAEEVTFEWWVRDMMKKFERVILLEHPDLKKRAQLTDRDLAALHAAVFTVETAHEQLKRGRWDVQERPTAKGSNK
jgi:hypothetical protein